MRSKELLTSALLWNSNAAPISRKMYPKHSLNVDLMRVDQSVYGLVVELCLLIVTSSKNPEILFLGLAI